MKKIIFFLIIPLTILVAAPSKEKVVAGDVEVLNEGSKTSIYQHSDKAVIHWKDFSIEQGERVEVIQPSKNGALLNRVTGKNASEIYGSLTSNGKVFLLNKNGIFIGPEGRIETAGFIASTLDIQDEAFLNGHPLLFSGESDANILNLGMIKTEGGGLFVLAKRIENSGQIEAVGGKAKLVGGTEILLKEDDPEQIYILPGSQGTVSNEGMIKGVEAVIKAASENAYALAINQSGLVQATGIQNKGGKVVLVAEQGITKVTGQLKAEKENGEGGIIHILGDQVGLMEKAVIDGSGNENGGDILIGGDFQGKNPLIKNAQATFIDHEANVYAHSKECGVGGRVIVWGDRSTTHLGSIDVSGISGGGFIEISSPQNLHYKGSVDLSTFKGNKGTLFLDPTDIIINNYSGSSNPHFPTSPGEYQPNVKTAYLDVSNLASGLNSGNVVISTSSSFSSQGVVTFEANLSWNAATTLTVNADSEIFCSGFPGLPVVIENTNTGSSNFTALDFNAGLTSSGGIRLSYASMTTQNGNIQLNGNVSNGNAIGIFESTVSTTGSGSNSGDITIQGSSTSASVSDTIYFTDGTVTTVDGNISINGVGGQSAITFEGNNQITTSGVTAQQGNINIKGSSIGTGSNGITFGSGSGKTTVQTQEGSISLEASAGTMLFDQNIAIGSSKTSGDISLVADNIDSASQFSNLQIAGTGALTVQQKTPSTSIGVGATAGAGLNLPTSFLDALQDGFSVRTFGRSDGTGSFMIGAYTHPDPLIMQNSSGLMQVNGALSTSGGDKIQLISNQMTFNSTISGTGILSIQPAQSSITIGIGDGTTGTLNLNTSSINNLSNGFSQITIGRPDQNSSIEIGNATFQDPLILYGKQISVTDPVNAGSNPVTFNLGVSSSGTLNLNGLVSAGSLQINGGDYNNAYHINVSGQEANLNGGNGSDSLSGPNNSNWSITGNNQGILGSLSFINIPTLIGGDGNDQFTFNGTYQIDQVDGGGGTNTVIGPNVVTEWTITGNNQATMTSGSITIPLKNIQSLIGGNDTNTFVFTNGAAVLDGTIDGGSGSSILKSANVPATWDINTKTSGAITMSGNTTQFQNMGKLEGSNSNDIFNLAADITLPSIEPGEGINTLNYTGIWSNPVTVDLKSFIGFQVINGPSNVSSALIGMDETTIWNITTTYGGTMTNTHYPSEAPFTFSNFTSISGGSANDTFNLSANVLLPGLNAGEGYNVLNCIGTWTSPISFYLGANTGLNEINGPLGQDNTLVGNNQTSTWHITGNDQGTFSNSTYSTFTFTNFPNIGGGDQDDTFYIDGSFQLTGSSGINGGLGSNKIQGPDLTTEWVVTGDNEGNITPSGANGPTKFSSIGSLSGGNGTNNYNLSGAYQLYGNGFVGGAGTNTITAPNLNNTWHITSDDTGYINPINASGSTFFSGISSIIGGNQDDSIIFTAAACITGGIDGKEGTNSVTGPNLTNTWTITGDDSGTLFPTGAEKATELSNIQNFIGGSEVDTFTFNGPHRLTGDAGINGGGGTNVLNPPPTDVDWTITGNNAGTLRPDGASGATNFSNIPAINGGAGNDTIVFTTNAIMTGGINGNGGDNSVTAPDIATVWTIDGNNSGSINPGAGVTTLTGIQTFIGGNQEDTFTLTGGYYLDGGIKGGGGTSTLVGSSGATTWHITGNDAGTIEPSAAGQTTPFFQVASLKGGGDDTFIFDGAYYLSGSINGNSGNNQITGPDVNTAWTINGIDTGSLLPNTLSQSTSFSNIRSIVGGAGNDAIVIATNARLTGSLDGGEGINQVTGPDSTTTWTITADSGGTLSSGGLSTKFNNIQALIGGTQGDTFIFNGAFSLSGGINGREGTNLITGPNVDTTWTLLSLTSGTITSTGGETTTYQNISSIQGGSGNDTFNLSPDVNNPSIDAGGGVNTLTYTGTWSTPASIDLNTIHGFQIVNGPAGLDNTLQGNNLTNTWHITGDNAGTLTNAAYPSPTNFTFTNFPSLTGGTSSDAFIFDGAYRLSGLLGINGGVGVNTLTGPNINNDWHITGNNAGNVIPTGSSGETHFSNITSIQGGTAQDTLYFAGPFQVSGGIIGNGTGNTVVGPDVLNLWTMTTNNGGTLAPQGASGTTSFTAIQTLRGGASNDDFVFLGTYQIDGSLDGGGGENTLTAPNVDNTWDILSQTSGVLLPSGAIGSTSYSNIGTLYGGLGNDTFNLTTNTLPPTIDARSGINTISFGDDWTIPVTIDLNKVSGFQVINGPSGLPNRLIGNNQFNRWYITADDSGTLENTTYPRPILFTFTNFPNLQGGAQIDAFFINGAFKLTGTTGIDGGEGINTLYGPPIDTVWNVASINSGQINPEGAGSTSYTNVSRIIGNIKHDTFQIAPNIILPTMDAGSGPKTLTFDPGWTQPAIVNLNRVIGFETINAPAGLDNILIGNNLNNTWNITADQQGTLVNTALTQTGFMTFTEFSSLIGGTQNDTFVFADGASLAGFIDGGVPATNNILDYQAFSSPASISFTGSYSGTASNLGKGFVNIGTIVGNYTADTPPSALVSSQRSLKNIWGLQTDLTLTLTKEIEYFQINTKQKIDYAYWTSILQTVLNLDDFLKEKIEYRLDSSQDKSTNVERSNQGQFIKGK